MTNQNIEKGILICKKELSRYGIELENDMRTLHITARCVPLEECPEGKNPFEYLVYGARYRKNNGNWYDDFGLLKRLQDYGCVAAVDYVRNPRYQDEEYPSRPKAPVFDESDFIATDMDMEIEEPDYFPDPEVRPISPVMGIRFGFTAVEEVVVDPDNPYFSSRNGVLFNKDMTLLIWYPYKKQDTAYRIPDGVREIGSCAFAGTPHIFSVKRENGRIVQEKGRNKYYAKYVYNKNLHQVILPDTVTMIRDNAFNHCLALTHVELSSSLKEILWSAFRGCKRLSEIQLPDSLEYIEPVFEGCDSLKRVKFAGTKHQITRTWETYSYSGFTTYYGPVPYSPDFMRGLFGGCLSAGNQPAISFETPWFTLRDGVMFNQDQTELIWCDRSKSGAYTVPDTVVRIGDRAFMDCPGLTQITISHPDTVIGEMAFFRCQNLRQIVFQNSGSAKEIGAQAFQSCEKLQTIPLTGVEAIGAYAFLACRGLREVTVPESCICIGEQAFDHCDNLHHLYIPKTLTDFQYRCAECYS